MSAGRLLSLAAAVLLAAPLAAAATPAPSPSLDEIVARHVKARGGLGRLHGLRSLRQTGTVTASGGGRRWQRARSSTRGRSASSSPSRA